MMTFTSQLFEEHNFILVGLGQLSIPKNVSVVDVGNIIRRVLLDSAVYTHAIFIFLLEGSSKILKRTRFFLCQEPWN